MTRLAAAFLEQASHCDKLGSAFMARLLRLMAQHWPIEGALAQRLKAWPGDIGPKGASLPLRLASALHALVLNGQSAQLRTAYPPHHTSDDQLIKAIQATLTRHGRFIENWLNHPPQTNEVARSAGLIPAAMWLQHQYKLPIFLSELGASAGLNLGFDRFALTVPGHRFGPDQPVLDLAPDWHGPVPTGLWPHIAERAVSGKSTALSSLLRPRKIFKRAGLMPMLRVRGGVRLVSWACWQMAGCVGRATTTPQLHHNPPQSTE